jgi:Fur family ferric uptake transcriptional regulator
VTSRTDIAREALQARGLRATHQRVRVLETLMGLEGDITAQALHERLGREQPAIGLATVYRTLTALEQAGVIDALQHGHGTCWRFCAPGHHHHLTCVSCHRVVELHDCEVGDWADRIATEHGFSGVQHLVELSGTCAACRAA